jgi:predicted MFS family arabinose efflux permease
VQPLIEPPFVAATEHDPRASQTALGIATLLSIGFAVLLPVIPVIVERRGHTGDAGAATAALLATTVISEFLTPVLIGRISSRVLVMVGMALVGLPCFAYLIPSLDLRLILLATAIRGVGFGTAGVVCMALTARHSPPQGRGMAIGIYGTAFTLPIVIFPPLGLYLLGAGAGDIAALIGAAAGVAGALAALRLTDDRAGSSLIQLRHLLPPTAVLAILPTLVIINMTFGAVVTFVPVVFPVGGLVSAATFLLISGVGRVFGRLASGPMSDRISPQLVMLAGAVATTAGLVALPLGRAAPLVIAGAAVYGLGAGAVQTTAFLAMLKHRGDSDVAVVTGAWNTAVDIGTGSGGAALGLIAATYGYGPLLWTLPFMAAAARPAALLSMRVNRPS